MTRSVTLVPTFQGFLQVTAFIDFLLVVTGSWEKHLGEGRLYFGSWFKGAICHGGKGEMVGM